MGRRIAQPPPWLPGPPPPQRVGERLAARRRRDAAPILNEKKATAAQTIASMSSAQSNPGTEESSALALRNPGARLNARTASTAIRREAVNAPTSTQKPGLGASAPPIKTVSGMRLIRTTKRSGGIASPYWTTGTANVRYPPYVARTPAPQAPSPIDRDAAPEGLIGTPPHQNQQEEPTEVGFACGGRRAGPLRTAGAPKRPRRPGWSRSRCPAAGWVGAGRGG